MEAMWRRTHCAKCSRADDIIAPRNNQLNFLLPLVYDASMKQLPSKVKELLRIGGGILAVLFYLLYVIHYVAVGRAYNIVWTCHIGCLLVGVGLLSRKDVLNSIGLIWVTLGIPLWILNLISGSQSLVYSFLTHWGGFFLGLLGVYLLGIRKGSWWKAILAIALFAPPTHFLTPPAENVNLVHSIWPGWENVFGTFPLFLLAVLLYCSAVAFGLERILLFFRPRNS
jgi:hypothetical protein